MHRAAQRVDLRRQAERHFQRGLELQGRGDLAGAIQAYRVAVKDAPDLTEAHLNLGVTLQAHGEREPARAAYRRVLDLQPEHAVAHNNLGAALADDEQFEAAVAHFREAVRLQPEYFNGLMNLGICLSRQKRHAEAVEPLRAAARVRPDSAAAHHRLGTELLSLWHLPEAVSALRRAAELAPRDVAVWAALGVALYRLGHYSEAIAACEETFRLGDPLLPVLNTVANCYKDQGLIREALDTYHRAQALDPDDARIGSNILLTLHYDVEASPEEIFAAHRAWGRRYAATHVQVAAPDPARGRDPRLRIGYYSPDLRTHSVAYFIDAVLRQHDPAAVEVFCYADQAQSDATTERLRSYGPHWRDVYTLDDAALLRQMRADRLDILVDLAGHTGEARPLLFAHKPAPIQMTYLGYPDGTGMSQVDYRITDAVADPPGTADALHVERLARLSGGFLCYTPPEDAGEVPPPPCLRRGYVTFGSFNLLAKVNEAVVQTWARLLHHTPGSRLLLKSKALSDGPTRDRVVALLAREGIGEERLELLGRLPGRDAHLSYYGNIDVALDPFPYNGTTTTCEALWMGVPVVTLAGRHHASRVGASLLTAIGRDDWIASTPDDYVAVAARLAAYPSELAGLRFTLRERLRRSPLLDGRRVARELEAAYREAWRARLHPTAPDPARTTA